MGRLISKKCLILFFFFVLLLSKHSDANECGKWFDNLNAPVCTNARYVFWTGTFLTTALFLSKRQTVDKVRSASLRKKPLQEFSKVGEIIGWGYLNGLYVLGTMGYGISSGSRQARQYSELMVEASAYTLLLTIGLKEAIQEERPGFPGEYDSFPSGHASMSFAFASVVTANHAWYWGILSHLTALFISYSRVQDDRHFLHDVVAGATLGMSYGWGIYFNHKKYRKPYWFGFLPTENMDGIIAKFAYNF